MRTGIFIATLILAALLLVKNAWFDPPASPPQTAHSVEETPAQPIAKADIFKAIAPLKITSSTAKIKTSAVASRKPTAKPTLFKSAIKQRDNKQQNESRFEKIAFNGDLLSEDASQWSCALDIETGLMWETKLSNGGISDRDHTYSWFNPDRPAGQQGKPDGGNCYGSACDTHAYITEMNRMALCKSTQWRLPLFPELERLIDRTYYDPTLNQAIFPNTLGTVYWSGTELENNPGMVMQVDFFNGISNAVPKNLSYSLRAVSRPN